MIKVIQINDTLNVSFDYDADIVSKVKQYQEGNTIQMVNHGICHYKPFIS
ncbi:hypothetical protein [Clostridium sporogenes]|nr:hypothetical protein [Clostridium sporogenes]MCW6124737.1 hypothetical protein [Clostridium sporogenes]